MKKSARVIRIAFGLLVTLIISCVLYVITKNPNVLFFANIACMALFLRHNGLSFLSIQLLLVNYCLLELFIQANTGESYGILQFSNIPLQLSRAYGICLIYQACLSILSLFRKKNQHNVLLGNEIRYSEKIATVYSVLSLIFAFIAFPSMNFSFGDGPRFNSLLPGNAWNHVSVLLLIFSIPYLKKNYIIKIFFLATVAWFLFHSERVDMAGIIVCTALYYIYKERKKIKSIISAKYVKYGILLLVALFAFINIGEIRGGAKVLGVKSYINKVLVQNTACDVAYVYNVSILDADKNGYKYGKTYATYIVEALPFINYKESATNYLRDKYSTPGGIFVLSEPYMNFGYIGVVLFAFTQGLIVMWLEKRRGTYPLLFYMYLAASSFRISWYGIQYIETGILFILPILYYVSIKFSTTKRKEVIIDEK